MTIIETAKFSGLNPEADLFARIQGYKINRIGELLPWNWVPVEKTRHKRRHNGAGEPLPLD